MLNNETKKNKLLSVILILSGMVPIILDNDGTFFILALIIGVPLFFSKGE